MSDTTKSKSKLDTMLNENPVLAITLGLAIGVALGSIGVNIAMWINAQPDREAYQRALVGHGATHDPVTGRLLPGAQEPIVAMPMPEIEATPKTRK